MVRLLLIDSTQFITKEFPTGRAFGALADYTLVLASICFIDKPIIARVVEQRGLFDQR
jgi:hypothetical protein